jgi:hypothetical protein
MLNDVTESDTIRPESRPVAVSLDELLAGATDREPMLHSDSKSGVAFERMLIDGVPHVLKCVHIDDDWTMRFFGETTCVPLEVWRTGMVDVLPERIDHTIVAVAEGIGRDGLGAALLMRDVGTELLAAGDELVTLAQHGQLIDDMAALAARTWEWSGHPSLLPFANRWLPFGDATMADEERRGWPNDVPRIAADGWARFAEVAPPSARQTVLEVRRDLSPLVDALAATPMSFLHGDWKMGNLGIGGDGRSILLDWTYCGPGPVCHELGWYLALNRARLPESKEASADRLRAALERHGIDTDPWWDRQLRLSLLGTLVQFGWEKALGDTDELGWWCDRAMEGALLL